jgi:hypothetical protein
VGVKVDYQRLSDFIRGYQTLSGVIRHYQGLSEEGLERMTYKAYNAKGAYDDPASENDSAKVKKTIRIDKIEFRVPMKYTVGNRAPRNRRLAEAFSRCGLVERSAQGMNRVFETCVVRLLEGLDQMTYQA